MYDGEMDVSLKDRKRSEVLYSHTKVHIVIHLHIGLCPPRGMKTLVTLCAMI